MTRRATDLLLRAYRYFKTDQALAVPRNPKRNRNKATQLFATENDLHLCGRGDTSVDGILRYRIPEQNN